jgi:hypothetical protein
MSLVGERSLAENPGLEKEASAPSSGRLGDIGDLGGDRTARGRGIDGARALRPRERRAPQARHARDEPERHEGTSAATSSTT